MGADDPTGVDRVAKVGVRITAFLRKHLRRYAEVSTEMVTCTITQLRNRLNYEIRKLVTADAEFAKNYADRTVHALETDEGIGVLSITNSIDQVKLARHRLHLSAKALRSAGDGRTIEQLLTDPAGDPVALSTKSYSPTDAIWRYVVATTPTCVEPGCDRPSVECELDHDKPWPHGTTAPDNLAPRCRRHHKLKHARAVRPEIEGEYAYAS